MSKNTEIKNANIPQMNVERLIETLAPAYSGVINAGMPLRRFPSVMLWARPAWAKVRRCASSGKRSKRGREKPYM